MKNCDAFCQCHNEVGNLLSYALLELKQLSGKRERFLFYQISDKPSSKTQVLNNVW